MKNFNFNQNINKGLLKLEFKKPTDIQQKAIPYILKDQNVVVVSQTGSGKTYVYVLPILQKLDYSLNQLQAIIVLPTRELARQVYSKISFFKDFIVDLKISLLIGGTDKQTVNSNSQILICTPQKLKEYFDSNLANIKNLKYFVLDEADMLLDMGFFPLINNLFSQIKNIDEIVKIALSATLYEALSIQIKKYFTDTKIIDTSQNIWKHQNITHHVIHFGSANKIDVLKKLLLKLNPYFCIIFVNTKKDVEQIYKLVYQIDKNSIALHGGLTSRERKNAYKSVTLNKPKFLVATDLASRGIDIEGASHIISFDMPEDDIWYIHRSGRTGRQQYHGDSYVFLEPKSEKQIIRLQNKGIVWNSIRFNRDDFIDITYTYLPKVKKRTEVDEQIKKAILIAPKKVKPNYKKKLAQQIAEIKRKAKRARIEEVMNKERIKKYKIENAKKTREKNNQK